MFRENTVQSCPLKILFMVHTITFFMVNSDIIGVFS